MKAMKEVYQRRILRGKKFYSTKQLGAFGSELTVLAGFFDGPWSQPSTHLTAKWQAFALKEAAFVLQALGRLAEAVEPMRLGLEADRRMENWKSAAKEASNLSHLTLTLGDVPGAVASGEQSVELADRSGATRQVMSSSWKAQADALHQAGRWEESAAVFSKAEAMGFRYCALLLSRAEPEDGAGLGGFARPRSFPEEERFRRICREVLTQGNQNLRMAENKHLLLDVSLHHLSLGRAYLGLALTASQPAAPGEDRAAGLAQAAESLDRSVDGLRQAGREDHLPLGLLARAALRRFRSDFTGAAADLADALEIAERGPMRLHECDAHLEWARLCRDQGDVATARRHVARARVLVRETGYGRREREVRWLEGVLGEGDGTSS